MPGLAMGMPRRVFSLRIESKAVLSDATTHTTNGYGRTRSAPKAHPKRTQAWLPRWCGTGPVGGVDGGGQGECQRQQQVGSRDCAEDWEKAGGRGSRVYGSPKGTGVDRRSSRRDSASFGHAHAIVRLSLLSTVAVAAHTNNPRDTTAHETTRLVKSA